MFPRPTTLAILFLGLFLLSQWAPGVPGIAYSTQLQPMDTVLYKVSGKYSENVSTTEMVVLTVQGTNLTASFKDRYYDGDERVDAFWIDLATGQRNSSNLIFAVGTGLNPGDQIPNGSNSTVLIDHEEMRDCGGASRLTGYARYQYDTRIGTQILQGYWDKKSGAMCDFSLQDPGGALSLHMMSTNLWSPDTPWWSALLPWFLLSILAIPLLLIVVVRGGRRRGKSGQS